MSEKTVGGLMGTVLKDLKGIDAVVGKTMMLGLRTMTTSVASSAVNAFNIDKDGNLGWSGEAFGEGVKGGAFAALASMTSTLTGGLLDSVGLTGFYGALHMDGQKTNAFLSGLAGQAVTYGLTGETSFNLLNLADLGAIDAQGKGMNGGLLELKIGKNGASLGLGSGGMDVSIGTTMGALKGLSAWGVNARMAFSGQKEAWKYASAMRTLYSGSQVRGKEAELTLFEEILSGTTNVEENMDGDYEAVTTREGGERLITLGSRSKGLLGQLGLGVVLSHEAYRDGYKGTDDEQRKETDTAAISHMHTAMYLEGTYGAGSFSGRM
ncbi:MAG: hypothetical protein KKA67_06510, partial [Spirochaetes bacterium]|nr:hypothetical protein [Spirochaetota bacterium]